MDPTIQSFRVTLSQKGLLTQIDVRSYTSKHHFLQLATYQITHDK